MRARISVIVPVRDGTKHLRWLIAALERQTLPRADFDVIIADDGSADGPERFATDDGWIRVIPSSPGNAFSARNRGVEATSAPSLAFCDADCVPEPTWLARGLAALSSADVVAGRIRFQSPRRRTTWAFVDIENTKNQERLVRDGVGDTANLFVTRAMFDRVGGFDGSIATHSDYDFVERCCLAGARLVFAADAVVEHPVRDSRSAVLSAQWAYCHGYGERMGWRGLRPDGLRLRTWIPLVSVMRGRRRAGMTLMGPDAEWMEDNGLRLTRWERLKSLPVLYVVLPYWRNVGQVAGWWRGRASR